MTDEHDSGDGDTPDQSGDWTDRIVGERMQLDQEFSEKVRASHFSRQQWGLVMTAVDFEIEHPEDPDSARLVADTSKLDAVLPEIEDMEGRGGSGMMSGPGGSGGSPGGSGGSGGGLFDGVKKALGLGGDDGPDREQRAAAEEMAQMYADDLQTKLEASGKWETVCVVARE